MAETKHDASLRRLLGTFLPLLVAAGCLSGSDPADVAPDGEPAPQGDPVCLNTLSTIDLQQANILDLQRELGNGNLTSVGLVEAYIARIEAFDNAGPRLNSVQAIHPGALAQAGALDLERGNGSVRGPLHGITILLKDNVGTVDLPTTAGSIALEKNLPPLDATLTARLRDAGAIILGKTQLSEFANWVSLNMPNGYSSLGGQVVNAYTMGDPSGSSSGSGVAGSMAFATITIGTETSGSILSPSNANSLVGLKPTLGLVSRAGVIPLAGNFDTPGPMGRNVLDVALVLGAIAGPDARDAATEASRNHLPTNNDYAAALSRDALQGVRLGYQPNNSPIFQRALTDLEALGAILVPIDSRDLDIISLAEIGLIPNEFKYGINWYLAEAAGPGLPVRNLDEIILYNQDHPDRVKYGQDLLIASDATPGVGPLADVAALPVITANRGLADDFFERNDVVAIVGHNAPFTGLGAAAGYPTVVVPAGYNARDPQGLSFFGPAWSEERLLAYAYAYEQASLRRVPPPTINPSLLDNVCADVSTPPADTTVGAPSAPTRVDRDRTFDRRFTA